jgi:HEAT repeat protein
VVAVIAGIEWRLPFELWNIRKLDASDPEVREAALRALVALRSERGLAALLEQLSRDDPPPPGAGDFYLRRAILLGRHHDGEMVKRLAWTSRCRIAVKELSGTAVALLGAQLGSGRSETRQWAAWFLGQMGESAAGAMPALLRALADPDPAVRDHAEESAAIVGRSQPALLDPCVAWLGDEGGALAVRKASLMALAAAARLSPEAPASSFRASVWSHLGRAAASSEPRLRALALAQLIEHGDGGPGFTAHEVAGWIRSGLGDTDADVREIAVRHLQLLKPIREDALAAFLGLLRDRSSRLRAAAAGQIRHLESPLTREAFAALADRLGDEMIHRSGIVERLHSEARAAVPHSEPDELLGALSTGDRASRVRAAVILGHLTSRPEAIFPVLLRAVDDEDPTVQAEALISASGMAAGHEGALVRTAAAKLRSSSVVRVHRAAARVLGEHKPAAREILPALREAAAAEPDPGLRGELTGLVAAIGEEP